MRIRRQAISRVSSSLAISSTRALFPCKRAVSEKQLCQLNRSPWDVMPFAPQSYLSYPKKYQIEEEEESTVVGNENGSGREAVCAVAKLKDSCEIKVERIEEKKECCEEQKTTRICRKRGGKGWRCSREAKQGDSLCSHHLMQRRSYHYEPRPKSDDEQPAAAGARRRSQRKSYSGSSDFYYYSGFGPLWGKKRGGMKKEKGGGEDETNVGTETVSSPNHDVLRDHHENDNDDDVDENGIDDDEDVKYRRRKGRKPMKARSLKSLL